MLVSYDQVRNDRVKDETEKVKSILSRTLFKDIDHSILSVEIELDGDMEVDGFCTQEGEYDYTIELRKGIKGEDLMRTLIHEFIHIYQYVAGDLRQEHIDGLGPRMIWKGEDLTHLDYNDRPWEIEAHSLEDTLYKEMFVPS